jgi:hypothetical protein
MLAMPSFCTHLLTNANITLFCRFFCIDYGDTRVSNRNPINESKRPQTDTLQRSGSRHDTNDLTPGNALNAIGRQTVPSTVAVIKGKSLSEPLDHP